MQKKLLIYIFIIFVISLIFLSGYYLLVFSQEEKQELINQVQKLIKFNDSQNGFINTETQEIEVLLPIRESKFLIDGEIALIDEDKATTEISVLVDMDNNFKNPPVPKLIRIFLITENTIFFVSDSGRANQDILSGGISRLAKGDLVAIETESSVEDILNQEVFFAIKLWKIVK
jgi:hypothetical protein